MKWISVKDRMPDHNDRILVIEDYYKNIYMAQYYNKQFEEDNCGCCRELESYRVTHWMPLPVMGEVHHDDCSCY